MRHQRSTGSLPAALLLSAVLFLSSTAPTAAAADADNGLKIDVTRKVSCVRHSEVGDQLVVNYRGTLVDGTVFDSSYDRHQPFSFTIGVGRVIKGWDVGMLGMCPGEARTLTIPANMAYGNRAMGKITAGSTLLFDTELLEIKGVPPETPEKEEELPSTTITMAPGQGSATSTPAAASDKAPAPQKSGAADGPNHDASDNGECRLLGPFAILIQGALGLLAFLSLVWKRWRERPRRPMKIWFFDVSKQVFGSVLLHVANLFMSMLSSGDLDVKATAASQQDINGQTPNPCSFYLLNLAIDTTIGIPILVLFLRILHRLFLHTSLANPPESLKSGNYGHPPRVTWWLKQSVIYFIGLVGMKMCVFAIFQIFPFIGWVGDWALRWTEGREWVQITFVMLIFPLVMNAAQYYIIDSFIKDPAANYEAVADADGEDSENEGLIHPAGRGGDLDDEDAEDLTTRGIARGGRAAVGDTKRRSSTSPMPSFRPSARPGSSSGASRLTDDEEDKK